MMGARPALPLRLAPIPTEAPNLTQPTTPWAPDTGGADLAAQRLIKRVLQQWWLVALCAIIAGGAAFLASSQRTKQYQATSTIEIGTVDLISVYLSDSVQVEDSDPERLKAGAVESFSLPNVVDRAAATLQGRVAADQISQSISVESVPDSSVLKITSLRADPREAQAITNAMVYAFIAQRKATATKKVTDAQNQVRSQFNNLSAAEKASIVGQNLQQRLRQVGVLGAISDGNVTVIQGARLPKTAVSPRPKRDAILGLVAGLLLGGGIALLRARLDDRIRETEELTELWNLPIVGLIPQTGTLKDSGRVVPEPAAFEALSLARTNLRYLQVGGTVKTVVITSAVESEGKSTVTWNLGVAASLASSKVLVVEADLRRPKLTPRLELGGAGLSEVLAGIATIDDAISTVEVLGADGQVATKVDVLPAGLVPPSPIALLESEEAGLTLKALRERYDVILIDTPPATIVADAVALVDEVDAVVIVSRLGVVRRGAYRRLREILRGVDAPVIGQIVNSDAAAKSYGYYSSYTPKAKKKVKA